MSVEINAVIRVYGKDIRGVDMKPDDYTFLRLNNDTLHPNKVWISLPLPDGKEVSVGVSREDLQKAINATGA